MIESPLSAPCWLLVRYFWRTHLGGCCSSLASIPPPLSISCMDWMTLGMKITVEHGEGLVPTPKGRQGEKQGGRACRWRSEYLGLELTCSWRGHDKRKGWLAVHSKEPWARKPTQYPSAFRGWRWINWVLVCCPWCDEEQWVEPCFQRQCILIYNFWILTLNPTKLFSSVRDWYNYKSVFLLSSNMKSMTVF